MSFNKLKTPIIGGNKKQREEVNKKAEEEKQMQLELIELQLKRNKMIVPFVQSEVRTLANGMKVKCGESCMFALVEMSEEERKMLQDTLNKYSGIQKLEITKKGEEPKNNIIKQYV